MNARTPTPSHLNSTPQTHSARLETTAADTPVARSASRAGGQIAGVAIGATLGAVAGALLGKRVAKAVNRAKTTSKLRVKGAPAVDDQRVIDQVVKVGSLGHSGGFGLDRKCLQETGVGRTDTRHPPPEKASGLTPRVRATPFSSGTDLFHGWTRVIHNGVKSWLSHSPMRLAAALAYYTLFSLAPFMFVAISIAGLVFGQEAASGQIYRQLEGTLGPVVASSVQDVVAAAKKPTNSMLGGAIAFGLVLFGASAMLGELKESLNIIWDDKGALGGGIWKWIRGRFMSIGMVMGVCFLLLVSLLLSAGLSAFGQFGINRYPGATLLLQILSTLLSFAFISVLFATMFKYLPNQRVAWADVWVGGILTAGLFTLGKVGLELYIAKAAVASSYGAAGAVAVVLVWVYYSSQIFFLGAAITRAYADHHGSKKPVTASSAPTSKALLGGSKAAYMVN